MKKIQNRILLFITLILIFFSIFFYQFTSSRLTNDSIQQQEKSLLSQLKILDSQLPEMENIEQDESTYIQQLHTASDAIQERITLISQTGEVLYDSHISSDSLENHIDRPEIQQINNGADVGKYHRESESTGETLYYSALPIHSTNHDIIAYLRLSKNEKNMLDLSNDFKTVLVFFILGSILITFLFIQYWSKQITVPIARMRTIANDLSKQDYSVRYFPGSYKEIDDLGQSINLLAVNLENQMTEINETEAKLRELINHLVIGVIVVENTKEIQMVNPMVNQLLGVDFTNKIGEHFQQVFQQSELIDLVEKSFISLRRQNKEVKIYYPIRKYMDVHVVPIFDEDGSPLNFVVLLYDITEIKKLEKVRTDFVANVSHELRTPITALKGFSETLLNGAFEDEEVLVDFLKIMNKEAGRLNIMVNDLLLLSKLEGKQEQGLKKRVNVKETVDEVLSILKQKIKMKALKVSIYGDEDLVLLIQPEELKQILINLLSNALLYTPSGGSVMIGIEQVEEKLRLTIEDTGIGIPQNQIQRIFERFYRVDKGRSRNSGGTGLGLSIVKWLVDNNKGRIEVESVVNEGTLFTIEFPLYPD